MVNETGTMGFASLYQSYAGAPYSFCFAVKISA